MANDFEQRKGQTEAVDVDAPDGAHVGCNDLVTWNFDGVCILRMNIVATT